jgi:hypothetical protein
MKCPVVRWHSSDIPEEYVNSIPLDGTLHNHLCENL